MKSKVLEDLLKSLKDIEPKYKEDGMTMLNVNVLIDKLEYIQEEIAPAELPEKGG